MPTIDNSRVLVLGCDPGSNKMALGLVSKRGADVSFVDSLLLTMRSKDPLSKRCAQIHVTVSQFLLRYPTIAAAVVETPVTGKRQPNSKTMAILAQARGALLAPLGLAKVPVTDINPTEMKNLVAGYGRATKADVARMVEIQLKLKRWSLKEDEADALGMALAVQTTAPLREVKQA